MKLTRKGTRTQEARGRLCRNIIIHGHCKFEQKGCEYNHERTTESTQPLAQETPISSVVLSAESPEFQPQKSSKPDDSSMKAMYDFPVAPIDFGSFPLANPEPNYTGYEYYDQTLEPFNNGAYSNYSLPMGMDNMSVSSGMKYHQNHQLDSYVFNNQSRAMATFQPLQHHLYSGPKANFSNLRPHERTSSWFFMAEKLRQELVDRNEETNQILDPNGIEYLSLPSEVHVYHTLYPINKKLDRVSKIFGLQNTLYKAIRGLDGKAYCLRRIENYRLGNEASIACIDQWTRIQHAGIVRVREGFTSKAFGDLSLVLVYDYHPLSTTLLSKYLMKPEHSTYNGIKPDLLWSFVSQLTSAIKMVHGSNLAVRVIEASKILLTGKNRIRINCCGIFDILMFDDRRTLQHHQQDDLIHFGQLILSLACGSLKAVNDLPRAIEHVTKVYPSEMKDVILYLLSKPSATKAIDFVVLAIAPRLLDELNASFRQSDILEDELGKECENGRLVRLLCKLGHINERPEFELDPTWSETGDRYLLKLYRDYVFHQVSDIGHPVVDLSHVISSLNKLDVGVDEKILLMSRDEQACLIVSYKELKKCVDSTFKELVKRSNNKSII